MVSEGTPRARALRLIQDLAVTEMAVAESPEGEDGLPGQENEGRSREGLSSSTSHSLPMAA